MCSYEKVNNLTLDLLRSLFCMSSLIEFFIASLFNYTRHLAGWVIGVVHWLVSSGDWHFKQLDWWCEKKTVCERKINWWNKNKQTILRITILKIVRFFAESHPQLLLDSVGWLNNHNVSQMHLSWVSAVVPEMIEHYRIGSLDDYEKEDWYRRFGSVCN